VPQNEKAMDWERIAQIRAKAVRRYEQSRDGLARLPAKARIVLGLFLFAAVLMALHTALSGKDASLHLTLQHGFRSADVSLWIDGDLSYSGKLRGSMKRKFGVIPGSVHGSLSEIVPVSAGTHQIRVRVDEEDGSTQQDSLTGDFARNTERELSVSARPNGLSLAWLATHAPGPSSGSGWLARYAGAVFLTIGGSIVSAVTGFALRELPAHIRARESAEPKVQSTAAGQ
jgi:hypothetical protein